MILQFLANTFFISDIDRKDLQGKAQPEKILNLAWIFRAFDIFSKVKINITCYLISEIDSKGLRMTFSYVSIHFNILCSEVERLYKNEILFTFFYLLKFFFFFFFFFCY